MHPRFLSKSPYRDCDMQERSLRVALVSLHISSLLVT